VTITNGFAQLNDANACSKCSGADWTQITVNPDLAFSDFKFAISLTGATDTTDAVDVYALLTGAANYAWVGTVNSLGNNINFELSGASFDAFRLQVAANEPNTTLGTLKQLSYEPAPGAVPEPATWAMMLLGFGGIGMAMRRSKRRSSTLMQVA
jgi:hypothetical protein